MAFFMATGCIRFARNCGKMYRHHFFLVRSISARIRFQCACTRNRFSFTGMKCYFCFQRFAKQTLRFQFIDFELIIAF